MSLQSLVKCSLIKVTELSCAACLWLSDGLQVQFICSHSDERSSDKSNDKTQVCAGEKRKNIASIVQTVNQSKSRLNVYYSVQHSNVIPH